MDGESGVAAVFGSWRCSRIPPAMGEERGRAGKEETLGCDRRGDGLVTVE